jgi:succinate dehydrogenase / fumarate reductase cytochrome b subunit
LEIDMTPRRLSPFSTIASKFLIALTGLSLVGFLCVHLIGNLLLYIGPAKFNAYSHALISNPLVIPAEIGLAAIFLLHMLEASLMWFSDRKARPVAYQQKRYAGGTSRTTAIHGEPGRDLYRLVIEVFRNPLWVGFYAVCMVAVGFHLWHAFSSAFESLGIDHPKLTPTLLKAGKILAIILGTGFFSIPIVLHFVGGRS